MWMFFITTTVQILGATSTEWGQSRTLAVTASGVGGYFH